MKKKLAPSALSSRTKGLKNLFYRRKCQEKRLQICFYFYIDEAQEIIRRKIVEVYFPEQVERFRLVISENQEINSIENLLLKEAENKPADISKIIIDTPKRNIAFRRAIIKLYDYTCAACRLRIITLDGETAVEAAHIFPFAKSFDDSIGNGLALCPLHH